MFKHIDRSKKLTALHHPKRYLQQVKQLVFNQQIKGRSKLFEQKQFDIALFNFGFDDANLATALAVDVRKERYQLTKPIQKIIEVKNKQRKVYKYVLTDKVVIGVFSQVLTELFNLINTEGNYGFQPDKGTLQLLKDFSQYIRDHRKKGLQEFYFFRTDFKNYTDEINISPNSIFWIQIKKFFADFRLKLTPYQWQLLEDIVRPEYYNAENLLQCNIMGVPTGSSITSFIYNFYGHSIDKEMGGIKDLFYARYCDDILICHPDKEFLKIQASKLTKMIYELNLSTNEKKDFWGYFTPAGKACSDPQFSNINLYNYLGFQVSAKGTFSLSKYRQRKFLRIIYSRIKNVYKSTQFSNNDHAGRVICQAINDAYTKPEVAEAIVEVLIQETSDLSQLKHLDYLIALYIAQIITGIVSVKSFRYISYAKIRQEWGLKSLICLRNNGIKDE